MPNATPRAANSALAAPAAAAGRPFFGLIDAVVVADPVDFPFEGAITRADATAAWTWILRDIAPDLIARDVTEADPNAAPALIALLPELLSRTKDVLASAGTSREIEHRLRTQLGGDDAYHRLPVVMLALKCRSALEKAQTFGRAANGIHDEAALAMALQSMPLSDRAIASLLMMAAVGQVANPSRLVTAAIRLAGGTSEAAITRAGFGPLIDALLAHAQNQIPSLSQFGAYADMDLVCRAIDRFHRLVRAVHGYVEMTRSGRWAMVIAGLTKTVSGRVEPKLRDVPPDVNVAMRRPREGADRVNPDQMLAALNGVFLLATVRDARDSLALNALFDQTWTQVGQTVEMHVQRNLDMLRANPADAVTAARLETAIKMAELRFGTEYAEILKRARETALRR
jgi:hypothetical protein